MRSFSLCLIFGLGVLGCARAPHVTTTPGPANRPVPTTIAVYPILTTESRYDVWSDVVPFRDPLADRDRIYIQPPSETKLMVTLQSQQLTDVLLAELSAQGFNVKELPVEVPDEWGGDVEGNPTFYISLGLLDRLREDFGFQAIVLGNANFARDENRRYGVSVAYLRVVDIETLDILCHVRLDGGDYVEDVPVSAEKIAVQLAQMAGLPQKE